MKYLRSLTVIALQSRLLIASMCSALVAGRLIEVDLDHSHHPDLLACVHIVADDCEGRTDPSSHFSDAGYPE